MNNRNLTLVSAALAMATSAALVKTTAAATFSIDGQLFTKAPTDNIPFASQFTGQTFNSKPGIQAPGTTALYGVFIDAAGTVTFVQGQAVSTADLAAGQAALMFPANTGAGSAPGAGLPRGRACLGFLRVANGSATGFVPGVTALNAAGVTSSFINTLSVPDEPLRS
jgi:hypothetical protein